MIRTEEERLLVVDALTRAMIRHHSKPEARAKLVALRERAINMQLPKPAELNYPSFRFEWLWATRVLLPSSRSYAEAMRKLWKQQVGDRLNETYQRERARRLGVSGTLAPPYYSDQLSGDHRWVQETVDEALGEGPARSPYRNETLEAEGNTSDV